MENRRNTRYGQVFKKYRKEAEISQAELADKMGVSRNTLINWEAGINFPDLDNVSTLCTILNIPLSELFGIYEKTDLKEGERGILQTYRSLSSSGKAMAKESLEGILKVEAEGNETRIRESYFPLEKYSSKAAAGTGYEENTLPGELKFVKRTHANSRADAIVEVSGRSMEPFYKDGDLVYIRYTKSYAPGDIVICYTADGAVIKAVNKRNELYSLNEELPYGMKYEDDHVEVQGIVLGKVLPEELPGDGDRAMIDEIFAEEIRAFDRKYE